MSDNILDTPAKPDIGEWQAPELEKLDALRAGVREARKSLTEARKEAMVRKSERTALIDREFEDALVRLKVARERKLLDADTDYQLQIAPAKDKADSLSDELSAAWEDFYDQALTLYGVDYRAQFRMMQER